jgi:thiol-disulfide isomerase/thioredoxin
MSEKAKGLSQEHAVCRRSVVCGLAAALLAAASAGAKELKAGDVPPDSLGRAYTGEKIKLSDYRGKVVVVTFWASWCTPCRKELPVLARIQQQVTTDRLQVLAVNYGESHQRYNQVVYALKPALKDAPMKLISDEDMYYGGQFGVKGIPHMVIIGPDGRIAVVHRGYGESEIPVLVDELNRLLAAAVQGASPHAPEEASSEQAPSVSPR